MIKADIKKELEAIRKQLVQLNNDFDAKKINIHQKNITFNMLNNRIINLSKSI